MKIHEIDGYIQSFYLAEYDHGLLLLDGLSKPDVRKLESYIVDELKECKEDLKLVIATHPHPDHAGGARANKKVFPTSKIATSHNFNTWYKGLTALQSIKSRLSLLVLLLI